MNKVKKVAAVFGVTSLMTLNIAFATTGKIATETIRIRESASTDSKIVEMGSLNEEVEIIGEEGNWYKVNFKGKEGYIYNKYVKVDNETTTSTPETTPVETPIQEQTSTQPTVENTQSTENKIGNVITQKTQLKILPSITSSSIAEVEKGKNVTLNNTIGNWTKVTINNVEGWIPNFALIESTTTVETPVEETPEPTPTEEQPTEQQPETSTENTINKAGYISSNASAHMRSGPGTQNESLGKLPRHTVITVLSEENGWYKVSYNGKEGYISKELVTIGEIPAETSSRSTETTRTASNQTATGNVVTTAQNYLGYNYVSGGQSPSSGFDCSGFTQYIYGQCGISLSRTAASQAKNGTEVSKAELQPGDLVYFSYYGGSSIEHVGIYIGNGQFIHAANSKRGIVYDTIESGYYADNYKGARRF